MRKKKERNLWPVKSYDLYSIFIRSLLSFVSCTLFLEVNFTNHVGPDWVQFSKYDRPHKKNFVSFLFFNERLNWRWHCYVRLLLSTISNTVICKFDLTFICEREAKGKAIDQFIPIFSRINSGTSLLLFWCDDMRRFLRNKSTLKYRTPTMIHLWEWRYIWMEKNRKIVPMKYRRIIQRTFSWCSLT